MRKLATITAAMIMLAVPGFVRRAGAADASGAPAAPSWEDQVEKALDKTVSFDWKGQPLPDVLAWMGKAAGAAVVLDPQALKEPGKVRITMSAAPEAGMTLRSALGNVLKLAGLRYTLKDQAIYVSSPERLVAELLAGQPGPAPAVPGVSYPMTEGDALAATVDFFDNSEEFVPETVLDFVRAPVDARFEKPAYRDAQGRLHFPGPPLYIQDPEIFNPYRRFSRDPWFLRPPYLAPYYWGPESRPAAAAATPEVSARETEGLKALLQFMRQHPEVTIPQLIQQLEVLTVKGAAPKQQ